MAVKTTGMISKRVIIFIICTTFLVSCSNINYVHEESPGFKDKRPSVIAVLPVMNETVDLDAPKPFAKVLRRVLKRRGYKVVSQEKIDRKLKEGEGINIAAEVRSIPDKELGEMLGAQALLFTTVLSWETVYLGVYASVTVGARFQLIDANTSEIIWQVEDEAKDVSVAFDKKSAQITAAFAVLQSYEPYVRELVSKSFAKLPAGPFYVPPAKPAGCYCFSP